MSFGLSYLQQNNRLLWANWFIYGQHHRSSTARAQLGHKIVQPEHVPHLAPPWCRHVPRLAPPRCRHVARLAPPQWHHCINSSPQKNATHRQTMWKHGDVGDEPKWVDIGLASFHFSFRNAVPVELQVPLKATNVRCLRRTELVLHGLVINDVDHWRDDVRFVQCYSV